MNDSLLIVAICQTVWCYGTEFSEVQTNGENSEVFHILYR